MLFSFYGFFLLYSCIDFVETNLRRVKSIAEEKNILGVLCFFSILEKLNFFSSFLFLLPSFSSFIYTAMHIWVALIFPSFRFSALDSSFLAMIAIPDDASSSSSPLR